MQSFLTHTSIFVCVCPAPSLVLSIPSSPSTQYRRQWRYENTRSKFCHGSNYILLVESLRSFLASTPLEAAARVYARAHRREYKTPRVISSCGAVRGRADFFAFSPIHILHLPVRRTQDRSPVTKFPAAQEGCKAHRMTLKGHKSTTIFDLYRSLHAARTRNILF